MDVENGRSIARRARQARRVSARKLPHLHASSGGSVELAGSNAGELVEPLAEPLVELAVLEGAGHFWWHHDSINTARLVADFMERHEVARSDCHEQGEGGSTGVREYGREYGSTGVREYGSTGVREGGIENVYRPVC